MKCVFFFAVYSRLLIGVGATYNDLNLLSSVEIIDLSPQNLLCDSLPDFPRKIGYAFGGLGYQNEPIICGGLDENEIVRSDCSSYTDSGWQPYGRLTRARAFGSYSFDLNNFGKGRIFFSGGWHGQVH